MTHIERAVEALNAVSTGINDMFNGEYNKSVFIHHFCPLDKDTACTVQRGCFPEENDCENCWNREIEA